MNIRDILDKDSVEVGAELSTKDEVLERLISLHKENGNIHNATALRREISAREAQGNSAVAGRIAIPGVSHSGAARSRITAVTVKDGVEYGAPDKKPVKLVFMIAGKSGSDEYLRLKTRLMRLLTDTGFTAALCAAKDSEEFIRLIEERERVRFAPTEPKKQYDCSKFLLKNNKSRRFPLLQKRHSTQISNREKVLSLLKKIRITKGRRG